MMTCTLKRGLDKRSVYIEKLYFPSFADINHSSFKKNIIYSISVLVKNHVSLKKRRNLVF